MKFRWYSTNTERMKWITITFSCHHPFYLSTDPELQSWGPCALCSHPLDLFLDETQKVQTSVHSLCKNHAQNPFTTSWLGTTKATSGPLLLQVFSLETVVQNDIKWIGSDTLHISSYQTDLGSSSQQYNTPSSLHCYRNSTATTPIGSFLNAYSTTKDRKGNIIKDSYELKVLVGF